MSNIVCWRCGRKIPTTNKNNYVCPRCGAPIMYIPLDDDARYPAGSSKFVLR